MIYWNHERKPLTREENVNKEFRPVLNDYIILMAQLTGQNRDKTTWDRIANYWKKELERDEIYKKNFMNWLCMNFTKLD